MSLLQQLARGPRVARQSNFRKPCVCSSQASWAILAPRYHSAPHSSRSLKRRRSLRQQSTLNAPDRNQRRFQSSSFRSNLASRLSTMDHNRQIRCFTITETCPREIVTVDSPLGDRGDDDEEEDPLPFLGTPNDPESFSVVDSDDDDALEDQDSIPISPPREGLFMKNTPLYELNAYYKNQHGLSSVSSCIEAESERVTDVLLSWSAVFTCPVSGRHYLSGTLRSKDPRSVSRYETDAQTKISYGKKKTAIQAAAARALDAIQYELLGIVEPRLCDEDPSVPLYNPSHESSSTGLPPPSRAGIEHGNLSSDTELIRESSYNQKDASIDDEEGIESDSDDSLGEAGENDEESEDSMELVWMPVASRASPPARRILDAISSSVSLSRLGPPALENERMPMPLNPTQRLKIAVARANAWAEAQQRYRHRRSYKSKLRTFVHSADSSEQIFLAGKAVLANLAEANQSTPTASTRHGAEEAASQVLAVLEATTRDGAATLNADVYTLFLRCLEDPNPLEVARKAEDLVSSMRAGCEDDGHIKPKPTIHTINALIQLYAQVGGTTGRYDRLEDDFRPDKESFLGILSSLIYRPVRAKEYRGFDAEFCRQCIKRMAELAQERGDDTLEPDTQVYNAPLRWYGGSHFRRTRSYARVLRAERFDLRFAEGLLREEDVSTRDAKAMEAWLDEMIESSDNRTKPDIETYEAIIQGWVRAATRRGLDRAQAIAEGLLIGKGICPRPRLQTFRPIVIAWALSKEPDAPEKIQALLDRLKDACESAPELDPDSRMYQYLMTSHVHTQGVLLGKGKIDCDELQSIVSSARACDRILRQLCDKLSTPSGSECFVEITPFECAVLAWRNAALAAAITAHEPGDWDFLPSFDLAMEGMVGVRRRFETALQRMKGNEASELFITGQKMPQELSQQLRHLLRFAHRVHSSLIVSLLEISSKSKDIGNGSPVAGHSSSILVHHLPEVESMLRTSGECNAIVDHITLSRSDSRLATLNGNQRAEKLSDSARQQDDLPHGHYTPAVRLTFPDQMSLVDSQLLPGWTYFSFIRRVVDYLRAIIQEKGEHGDVGLRRGDMVRILSILQSYPMEPDEDSGSDDISAHKKSRDAIRQLMNQLSPFQQGRRPWRQIKSATASSRMSSRG